MEVQTCAHPNSIPACIDVVKQWHVKYSVVPLENTLEGTVNLTLDYLIDEKSLKISSELVIPVEQHFMVHPNQKERWREIEKIYSHPHRSEEHTSELQSRGQL